MNVAPGLIGKVWELQYRESFCGLLEGDCSSLFHAYSERVERTWVTVLRNTCASGNALDWALRCIGSFRIGQMHRDKNQILASREIYGRAVRELARTLNNPLLTPKDETLAAAIVLGTYEILNDDGQGQMLWVTHSGGIGALMRLRGPKAHVAGFGRTLALSFRPWFVFAAFVRGERCFLEDDEWAAIIPEVIEHEKQLGRTSRLADLVEYSFHEVTRCPGYLAQTKSASSPTRIREPERKKLAERIVSSRHALEGLQRDISAGLNTSDQSTYHRYLEFIGEMPVEAAGLMGKYAIIGIRSAIALLQQLLVVLEYDRRRQPIAATGKENPWAVLNNNDGKSAPVRILQKDPLDPEHRGQESKEDLLVRLAFSMGMIDETPSI